MLGFLLSFLGLGAATALAGGNDDAPVKKPEVLAQPAVQDEHDDGMTGGTGDDHGDDANGGGTDDGHTGHGDNTGGGTDDGHTGHGDNTGGGTDDGHTNHDDDTGGGTDDGHTGHDDNTGGTDDGHTDHGDNTGGGTGGGHMGHGGDEDMVFEPIDAPQTEAEIAAFVDAVRTSPEMHVHDDASSKVGEHMAALDLVPRDEATHIAIGHGDWDDPANWLNGEVPGDDARVLIPEGIHMTYDHVGEARLFTVRVDGKLEFSTETNSQMIVDTLVIAPGGFLEIGTEANPVDPNVDVDIIFANNGAIDTNWDPMLLSRGMIAHGNVEIHGAMKDSHDKVVDDPMAGDTWIDMGETPEGWAVGDTIVIAGTHYDGWVSRRLDLPAESEDETRVITDIRDGMIYFDEPLEFDHDAPREDLKTSVANYTRNVSFETENAELAEIYERGHVMFMHNDDVDVRYAEFHELGRTDKSEPARNVDEFDSIDFDTNVKGRYAFHFHRAGLDDQDDPGISIGNAVYGSPGWGFVHHDSNAIFENNATYDTFGAGYVAESGNETGAWIDNIAIFAEGANGLDPKLGNDIGNFDLGTTGDGFWFQGRMVVSADNIAASMNNGFVYFHRGLLAEDGQIGFAADTTNFPSLFHYAGGFADEHPILTFDGNEAFATNKGLYVLKSHPFQGHDVHSVLSDFTAWNTFNGAELSYTAHYVLKNFDLVGDGMWSGHNGNVGIAFGSNVFDQTIIDAQLTDFDVGMYLDKNLLSGASAEVHDYTIIDPTFINVKTEYEKYDPALDTILSAEDLPMLQPDIALDGPLIYSEQSGVPSYVTITGTKTDSLGTIDFPTEAESFIIESREQLSMLNEQGYYSTSDGQNYYLVDLFFSDRLTGNIYMERHPVLLDENIPVGTDHLFYKDVSFNGIQDLGGDGDPTIDSAVLWATLTDGQVVLTEAAEQLLAKEQEEDAPETAFDML